MKKGKTKETGNIINFYNEMDKQFLDKPILNPNIHLHNFSIPFRLCCVAPSGSGKSNWITNLIHLFSIGRGTFAYIFFICKGVSEPLYKFLAS